MSLLSSSVRLLCIALLPTVFYGCALSPGMYLGVKGPASPTTESRGEEDIAAKADIYAINAETVRRLLSDRVAEESIAAAREKSARLDERPYQYYVSPQDVLRITVWNHPELTNPGGTYNELSGRVVTNAGDFFYPYIGQVRAAGRTPEDIRQEMATRLAKYLEQPQVEVAVQTYRGQRASVLGQVTKPGIIAITDVPLRITDLITQAEGLTTEADLSGATLNRGGEVRKIDLYSLYYRGDLDQNIMLRAGDILNIPERRFNKVFVLGEVIKPASVLMPRGRFTLAEALSDVGGVDPITSNAGQIYVIRAETSGRPQIWHLNASSPDALILADRFEMKARDVVYVDAASVSRFSRVINQIIPTATLLRDGINDARN